MNKKINSIFETVSEYIIGSLCRSQLTTDVTCAFIACSECKLQTFLYLRKMMFALSAASAIITLYNWQMYDVFFIAYIFLKMLSEQRVTSALPFTFFYTSYGKRLF